jgi:hypothetical protein
MADSLELAGGLIGSLIAIQIADRLNLTGAAIDRVLAIGTVAGIVGAEIIKSQQCFPASTPILRPDGKTTPIADIAAGDLVMAFDRFGELVPRKIVRLYRNVTTEWLELSFQDAGGAARSLAVTPGHIFLNEHGRFEQIGRIAARGGRIVDAEGRLLAFESRRIVYSSETKHLYEQATGYLSPEAGALALKPEPVQGWATYNFEVEELHTYVAGGIRVHNESSSFETFLAFIGDDLARAGAFLGSLSQAQYDSYVTDRTYTDGQGVTASFADHVGGAVNVVGTTAYSASFGPGFVPGGPEGAVNGPAPGGVPDSTYAPIILDLDGDGIELVGLGDSSVAFDVDRNGSLNFTGWAGPDDGFLVFDLNALGIVPTGPAGSGGYVSTGTGDATIAAFAALAGMRPDGTLPPSGLGAEYDA